MKKVIGVIIAIVSILWISLKLFTSYDANNVLYNQAAFVVFIDPNIEDIDDYFNVTKGTFDQEKHILVCKLPVKTEGFRVAHVRVQNASTSMDCSTKFDKKKHIYYQPYELKGSKFELLIVGKYTNLVTLNSLIGESRIIAKKVVDYTYSKGKINWIVFSKNGISEACK